MTIADLIKYIDFLKQRSKTLAEKVKQTEIVKTTSRIVGQVASGSVEEVTSPLIDAADLMSEFDKNAKELRLAQQALERANHTTMVDFQAQY